MPHTPRIFAISTLMLVAVLAFLLLSFPLPIAQGIAGLTLWVVSVAGSAVLWLCSAALLLSMVLVVGPWGRQKLSAPNQQPEFSRLAWLAMLFAAGMGSGLVFWGLAEPLSHFVSPPGSPADGAADPAAVASRALSLTYLHWGFHAWAVYAIAGLAFGYFGGAIKTANERQGPGSDLLLGLSGASDPSPGVRIAGGCFDLVALVAVLFGVAGSLANGVDLMQVGLGAQGWGAIPGWLLLALLGVMSLISAASGLRQGIRLLSLFNMLLALTLMCWLWWVIDWRAALGLVAESFWIYLRQLPGWSFSLIAGVDGDTSWAQGWTVVYLLWWIAWTPFVGIFLAGISRGRTIREYLLGVIVVPVVVSVAWFGAFGAGGLAFELANPGALSGALEQHYTAPLFAWYQSLPGGAVLAWGSLLALWVFLVTSADSATWVMSRLAGSWLPGMRWIWGVLMLLVSIALVIRGDVDINKQVAIAGAIPFALVLFLQMLALVLRVLPGGTGRPGQGRQKTVLSAKNSVN